MRWLRDLLLRNWPLKLLSLVLAYGLWAIVHQSPVIEIGVTVPLEIRHLPAGLMVASELPAQIYVQLRGPENRIRMLAAGDIGVALDLAAAEPGNHTLALGAENVERPPGIEVVRVVPEEVRLELAPK
jgi:YbbR domain-containing protein